MNQIIGIRNTGEKVEFTEEEKKKNEETLMSFIEESKMLKNEQKY